MERGIKTVLRKSFTISLIVILLLIFSSCNIITGEYDSPDSGKDNSLLSSMLHAVPVRGTTTVFFNDIRALSEYHNVAIPPRTASIEEKIEWWTTFQNVILYGYSIPAITEVWGFDSVDISGMLTYYGEVSVTILSGKFDTEAFRTKLLSYGYEESTYLGLPFFSGIPEPNEDFNVDILARAFGIINGAGPENDPYNLIIMSEAGDNDVELGTYLVEEAISAYRQNKSLANKTSSMTRLVEATGRAGAVYITTENWLEYAAEQMSEEQLQVFRATAGPGILNPYRGITMSYRRESGRILFDFILDYETANAAAADIPVLKERLKQGQSYIIDNIPLSEIWATESVKNQGTLLKATVYLLDTAPIDELFFIIMLSAMDYWFLYPAS